MKEQIAKGISEWVALKIDEIAEDNVLLTIASGMLKNGAKNIINSVDMSMILPFITKDGIVDAHLATDEIVRSINVITPKEVKIKGIPMTIGNSVIKIALPENNILVDILGISSITITESDMNELANYINNEI